MMWNSKREVAVFNPLREMKLYVGTGNRAEPPVLYFSEYAQTVLNKYIISLAWNS